MTTPEVTSGAREPGPDEREPADQASPTVAADPSLADWRFLLADAHLGRVGVDPACRRALRASLATCADSVVELTSTEVAEFDTVVLDRPTPRALRVGLNAIAGGGTLRIESLPRRRRREILGLLRAAGLQVSTWWLRPGGETPWAMIALDHPVAAATVLRTVANRGRRAPLEAWLARSGLARRWCRDVALLAVLNGEQGPGGRPAVAAPAEDIGLTCLLTPRFAASRAVVGVSVDRSGRSLAQVTKMARSVEHDHHIRAEASALGAFRERVGDVPRSPDHRLGRKGDRSILIEEAAPGRPLDRQRVRRDRDRALRAGVAWLDAVPVGPTASLADDGRGHQLISQPLQAIAELPTRDPRARRDHLIRATQLLEGLRLAELPEVFEHGDFSHPNLFLGPDGHLVAIDWERARPVGLPLHDLTFFVAYLAESNDQPRSGTDLVASYRRALRSGGWACADRDLHAGRMGIEPRLVQLLELATWTRTLARLAEPGRAPASTDGHRHELLWIASIEDADRGRR